jgi:RNA polymerase sigma factor (sigma-70 family)
VQKTVMSRSAERLAAAQADEVFAHLFSSKFTQTVRLAKLIGADDPENVAQEAFARLHMRMSRFPHPDNASRYLTTMTCNLARSRTRHLSVARRLMPKLAGSADGGAADPTTAVDNQLSLGQLIRRLPRRQREVLVLRFWLGLSISEAAAVLGLSPGSVKPHSSRALRALEERLREER